MFLQLILGGSGTGKSRYCYDLLIQESMKHPEAEYVLLVPEQFTMQAQKDLISLHPNKGCMNIEVLSFQRLAYRVFSQLGGRQYPVLDDTGKCMVLRKVAGEKKKELVLFGGSLKKQGYIQEMKSVISEFAQYHVTPDMLQALEEQNEKKGRLSFKLHDIRILYDAFGKYLKERYITSEELLERLRDKVSASDFIRKSFFVLDGFTGFTPVQIRLLEELLSCCQGMYATVTVDMQDKRLDVYREAPVHHLFHMSTKTIVSLNELAKRAGAERKEDVVLTRNFRLEQEPALLHLSRHLFRYGKQGVYEQEPKGLQLMIGKNPLEELRMTAREIVHLVREEGLRYQEIAVVTGALDTYAGYVQDVFTEYRIPWFMDNKRGIQLNPMVECIEAVLQIVADRYSYESVFRYLRCGLSDISPEDTDRLENYCLALGIKGKKKWSTPFTKTYRDCTEEELGAIEQIRVRFMEETGSFYHAITKRKTTVREKAEALYVFFRERKVQEKLKEYEQKFEREQEEALAREYAQIYKIVIHLLEQMVALLGEEEVSAAEFGEILESGFAEARVGIIPPGIDQVVIGDIERTRLSSIKVLFFIGVNDTVIPKTAGGGGILNDGDREALKEQQVELAPTERENFYIQKLYLYLLLTKPSRKLYLSYSELDAAGNAIRSSYLVKNIRSMFPSIGIQQGPMQDFPRSTKAGIDYVNEQLQQHELDETAVAFYHFLKEQGEEEKIYELLDGAFYKNQERTIQKEAARLLYGEKVQGSVTRMETFASCAYAHYLQYGLQLKERQMMAFEPVDYGNILHTALELFAKRVAEEQKSWLHLTEEERLTWSDQCVEESAASYGSEALQDSKRNAYMLEKMKIMMQRTTWALCTHLTRGEFHPDSFEFDFAMQNLKSLQFPLENHAHMSLRGRIDRIDICEDDKDVYVKVIDYKTSKTEFDLLKIYHGLQLQLVLYLSAASELQKMRHPDKQIIPAGIFYYHLDDPLIEEKAGETEEETKERLLKQRKMDGLVNGRKEIIEKLDADIGSSSSVIPVGLKKDGSYSAYSSIATQEEFQIIQEYVLNKIKKTGNSLIKGHVAKEPYMLDGQTGCDYCPYGGICGFDTKLEGFSYRKLGKEERDTIIRRMKEEE